MNSKQVSALAMAFILSIGISAKAATSLPTTEKNDKEGKKIELHNRKFKKKHHGGIYRTAKEIGITKEELKDAREKGGNFFELAKKKGYTENQVKDMMIKNKSEALDKAVAKGKVTEEKAKEIKERMKEKITKWDGTLRRPEASEEKSDKQ